LRMRLNIRTISPVWYQKIGGSQFYRLCLCHAGCDDDELATTAMVTPFRVLVRHEDSEFSGVSGCGTSGKSLVLPLSAGPIPPVQH
jgi:hypothetical protein